MTNTEYNIDRGYQILFVLSVISILFPLLAGVIRITSLTRVLRILLVLLICSAATELVSVYFSKVRYNARAVFILQNSYAFTECSLLMLMYYSGFTSKLARRIIAAMYAGYFALTMATWFFWGKFMASTIIPSSVEAWLLVGLAIAFLHKIQTELTITNLREYPFFWINCAVLLYFSSSAVLFLCNDYLNYLAEHYRYKFQLFWGLHLVSNIAYNALFTVALWKSR